MLLLGCLRGVLEDQPLGHGAVTSEPWLAQVGELILEKATQEDKASLVFGLEY